MENQDKHKWNKGKEWDTCRICGCKRALINVRGERYYEYSRSKLWWTRQRPTCIDWNEPDKLDNDSIEDFFEVK